MRLLKGVALWLLVLVPTHAMGDPATSQLAIGVERKLASYGYRVDGEELSRRQLSALHLILLSPNVVLNRQKVESILRWEDPPVKKSFQ